MDHHLSKYRCHFCGSKIVAKRGHLGMCQADHGEGSPAIGSLRRLLCPDCTKECSGCRTVFCLDTMIACPVTLCRRNFCKGCAVQCDACGMYSCKGHVILYDTRIGGRCVKERIYCHECAPKCFCCKKHILDPSRIFLCQLCDSHICKDCLASLPKCARCDCHLDCMIYHAKKAGECVCCRAKLCFYCHARCPHCLNCPPENLETGHQHDQA